MKLVAAFGLAMAAAVVTLAGQTKTVWDGVYSDAQAGRGKKGYITHCAECHNEGLQGGDLAPALKGEDFLLQWNDKSMAELFERTQKTMPQSNPGGLMPQETADIIAYMLQVNRMPAGQADLPSEAAALKSIAIKASR
jgi:mono/diheme cytochrome c family protein